MTVTRIGYRRNGTLNPEDLVTREWLVTNGLGGYASGTIAGVCTRRYHGFLVASLPTPLGRTMMLNHLTEKVRTRDGTVALIGGEEHESDLALQGAEHLAEFRLEMGLPIWTFEVGNAVIEKRVLLPHRQNTVHISYRVIRGESVRLKLRPSVHFRGHDMPVNTPHPSPYVLTANEDEGFELRGSVDIPPLRMYVHGSQAALTFESIRIPQLVYRIEGSRGYEARGDLWSPGYFRMDIGTDEPVTLVASTEPWESIKALSPAQAAALEEDRRERLITAAAPTVQDGPGAELVLAADQFVITPSGRVEDAARARATGEELRTVIAGYHWFTDWGRDTMISLPGLTLTTGRQNEARWILRTFGHYVRDGLIPNMFPEGSKEGLYHTADATLWMFQALDHYLTATDDKETLEALLPKLDEIITKHMQGTSFGIGADERDGLLRQGKEGYQLTWMDAKMDDWVVTPRRGKAVEINALWYNALRLMADWVRTVRGVEESEKLAKVAERAHRSFNERFWYEQGGHLYDVIDGEGGGDDPACRPNQVFAISLRYPVLDPTKWKRVVEVVQQRLLTPVGLRSLSKDHPDYKSTYRGDLRTRDAAYHQGTVWSWLIGPFVDAWIKVHPEDASGGRKLLEGLIHHLGEACVGSISEVFDAEPPYCPGGCIAQAWGVAEMLRIMAKLG